ncbi:MAG TPA: hypothetical protein VFR07_13840 [Mycobacteriales bacterium]|jgi:hypothetical protein|nr:hypothetical protein [Mycobacteriales bacterium]
MPRRPAVLLTAGLTATLALAAGGPAAVAAQVAHRSVVSAVPRSGTPQISNGAVYAVTQVGSTMVVGGNFTAATSADGSQRFAAPHILAFDAGSGAVKGNFRPQLDGDVQTLLPGPIPGTVYAGGEFNTARGVKAKSLVLLNLSDGSRTAGFAMPPVNGIVNTVKRVGDRLFVGGTFKRVGGKDHAGLVTLDARTGALDPYMSSQVAVNHNWSPSAPTTWAKAPVGVTKLDITPDGSKLVAIGNFKQVDGATHDQIAMWNLAPGGAVVRDWNTTGYAAQCLAKAYDSYVRDVSFSPDGSYFVVVATGGTKPGALCDAAARWETAATGANVTPTWADFTGGDSLLSTTVTGEAVYVGGHQRWLNNQIGRDAPGPGAVPRPGVAALDPATGLPLAWNPGRNPRGVGTQALYATSAGLWMGSDTDFIGTNSGSSTRYVRSKIAFFPLAGGRPAASKALAGLPGRAYIGARTRSFNGTSAGDAQPAAMPLDVAEIKATTMIGNTVFYATRGALYKRTLSTNGTWGPENLVDPYNDPVWSDVPSGSDGLTYRGTKPTFYAQIPNLTSMFFDGTGRLYYTVAGRTGLFSRAFSPDSGVMQNKEVAAPGVSLPALSGAFVSEGSLYYVTAADGNLHRASFARNGALGPQTVVSGPSKDNVDWRSRVLFLAPTS